MPNDQELNAETNRYLGNTSNGYKGFAHKEICYFNISKVLGIDTVTQKTQIMLLLKPGKKLIEA